MTVYPTIAAQHRTRHWWLLGGIAVAVAALALASVGAFAFRGASEKLSSVQPGVVQGSGMTPIMALTPARLAAGALGTGYQLPKAQHGPTIASVLASMDPKTRQYTEKIMALTFTQLAAGAAGHP
jgi:hypothetical protein